MEPFLPQCPKCRSPIGEGSFGGQDFFPCPSCSSALKLEIFPALFRRAQPGRDGEVLVVEGESSCFYHPQKKAARPCDGCGRFLCTLCDCELHGQHFCPACLEAGRTKGKIKNLENRRTCYDRLAMALAVYPIALSILYVGFLVMPLTAPATLFVAVRYWNAPGSLVRRGRARSIVAIVVALLEIAAWVALIYGIRSNFKRHG